MNRPEQFQKSIDTLATAYFEGDLKAGSCTSCAVGNLIRAEGSSVPDVMEESNWFWRLKDYRKERRTLSGAVTNVLPYSAAEIDRIESAFEEENRSSSTGEDRDYFAALMRVVDVLFDIHDVADEDARRDAVDAFDGDYETVDAVL